MNVSFESLTMPSQKHAHHAHWVIENKLAIGRKEPSRPGLNDGYFEIHFVVAHEHSEIIGRCSNLRLDFIPPDDDGNRFQLPCITIYKSMEELEYAEAIWTVALRSAEIIDNNPDISTDQLLRELLDPVDYLDLILEDPLMSVNAQRGLIGEIRFLLDLLHRCGELGIPATNAISAWKNEARDFNRNGITFEIKSSGGAERIHTISNISQLESRPTDIQLHVVSGSVCQDSGGYNLPEWIDILLDVLQKSEHANVMHKIRTWWRGTRGYDQAMRSNFINEPSFTSIFDSKSFRIHPPMVPEVNVLDSNSFVGGIPPSNANEIHYKLDLTNGPEPLSNDELLAAIDLLLG